jgi:hypothetical protein
VVAGLIFSPEAIRAKSAGRYRVDPVVEIKGALASRTKQIDVMPLRRSVTAKTA